MLDKVILSKYRSKEEAEKGVVFLMKQNNQKPERSYGDCHFRVDCPKL
jgi:hypothetical protein